MRWKEFWTSLPGILTGTAALVGAIGALYLAYRPPNKQPIPVVEPVRPAGSTSTIPQPANPAPTQNAQPAPPKQEKGPSVTETVAQWEVVANDTFSSPETRWWVGNFTDEGLRKGEIALVGGKYRWNFEFGKPWAETLDTPYAPVTDFYAAVDSVLVQSSGGDVYAGLTFGGAPDTRYEFILSSNNDYGLGQIRGAENPWIFGPIAAQFSFQSTNRIAVLVNSGHMTFYINGNRVGDENEPNNAGGQIGLTLGTHAEGTTAVVDFGNFELRRKPA